jgi:trehalose 6-phosphate phosphatase
MEQVRPAVEAFVSSHQGLTLEDKGATLAIHFREKPELAEKILAFLALLAGESELAVQPGKMVFELKPSQFDKGTAIAQFLATTPFVGRTPVFIGDDLTDEAGFNCVNSQGGVTIRISEDDAETKARYRLQTPADLRRELAALLER